MASDLPQAGGHSAKQPDAAFGAAEPGREPRVLAKMCSLQMSRNQEIANLLFDMAEGLRANGERGFRVMAYGRAAQRIPRMPEAVEVLCEMGHLPQRGTPLWKEWLEKRANALRGWDASGT